MTAPVMPASDVNVLSVAQPDTPDAPKPNESKGPAKEGLQASIDLIKYILTLSGGAIAFAMQPSFYGDSRFLKIVSLFCCASLVVSIFAGMLVHSRGCVMLSKLNYDLDDKYLKFPGQINQIAFGLGIVFLGIAIGVKTLS